jgi:hypothetical protein
LQVMARIPVTLTLPSIVLFVGRVGPMVRSLLSLEQAGTMNRQVDSLIMSDG